MHRSSYRSLAAPRALALPLVALLALPAARVTAQDSRFVTVTFASASATSNGFLHGTVRLRYRFISCGDVPRLFFSMEPGSAQGYEGYWYDGHMYGIQPSWRAPEKPAFDAELQVRFNAAPISVSPVHDPYPGPVDCTGGAQWRSLGKWSDFTSASMTREQALTRFDFDVAITRAPMRSADIESSIRNQIAAAARQARADSIQRARTAAAEQARRDSIARASSKQTTTAASASAGATTSGVATQAGTATATRSRDTLTAAQQKAEQQRQNDERARIAMENLRAEQAAQAAQNQQVESALTGMAAAIAESNRRDRERQDRRDSIAAAAYMQYLGRVSKAYANAPRRPACTAGDTMTTALSVGNTLRSTLTLNDCRTADETSAHQYSLHVAKKQMVQLRAAAQFYPEIKVAMAGTVLAQGESLVESMLMPGDYVVVVTTKMRGETGDYAITADHGTMSKTTMWSMGIFGGPTAGDWEGAAETPELGSIVGARLMGPINEYFHLVADGAVSEDYSLEFVNAGLRAYLGRRSQQWRPLVEWTYGWRKLFVDRGFTGEYYSGNGSTYAAGVEWFATPKVGLEAIIAMPTGTLNLTEPDRTSLGAPATVGYNQTSMRFGFMYHR